MVCKYGSCELNEFRNTDSTKKEEKKNTLRTRFLRVGECRCVRLPVPGFFMIGPLVFFWDDWMQLGSFRFALFLLEPLFYFFGHNVLMS